MVESCGRIGSWVWSIIMAIKVTIHNIDTEFKTAIISIIDSDIVVEDQSSTRIELNDDGTINTPYLMKMIKMRVCHYRLKTLSDLEEDLL